MDQDQKPQNPEQKFSFEEPAPIPEQQPPQAPTPPSSDPSTKKVKRLRIILFVVTLIAILLAATSFYFFFQNRDSTANERVKVGHLMAFTGGSSAMGYGTSRGIELAEQHLGSDNIEIIQADSKCDPIVAAEAVKTLIDQGVQAIIGDGCSSATVAALPAVNNAKVVMISPAASSPTLSIPNDYFFRVIPSDLHQGAFLAQTMIDQGIRRVAVFYTNEPYGSGMNQAFREKFEELGGQVVATANAEPDVIDLRSQMQSIAAASPEAVFFAPNSVVSGTAAISVGREVGLNVPFFGADIYYDNTIIANAPQAVEGLIATTFSTGTEEFKQALFDQFRVSEQLYAAAQAYDAYEALYRAIDTGARTGEEIKDTLPSISFEGVSTRIEFDENGEISHPDYQYSIYQITNGEFVQLQNEPEE